MSLMRMWKMPSPTNYIKLKLMTNHQLLLLMPMPLCPAVIIPLVLLSIQFLLIGPQASVATALSFSATTTTSVSLIPGFLGKSFITGTFMVLPKLQNQECAGPNPHLLTLEVICHQLCTDEQSLATPNVCWWPSLSYSLTTTTQQLQHSASSGLLPTQWHQHISVVPFTAPFMAWVLTKADL